MIEMVACQVQEMFTQVQDTPTYGEEWRRNIGGVTYRVVSFPPESFIPVRVELQRMFSVKGEPEAWEPLWRMA